MPRVAFATRAIDEAGNAVGGSAYQARVWDDFACTVATVLSDNAAGTVIAQPLTPNAGTYSTLGVTTGAGDTIITVASTTGFAVGQLITIYDSTNTIYRWIRSLTATTITLESAVGFVFSNTNTQVGNLDQIGVIAAYVSDTSYHYLQITEVASGRKMPPTLIPTMIGTSNVAILEQGAAAGTRPTINFLGTAITAVDNAPSTRVDVTVGGDFSDQTFIRVGANAAATGAIRVPNAAAGYVYARNAANTADVGMIGVDTANVVYVGTVAGTDVQVGTGYLRVGSTPATAGVIRIPNNQDIYARNQANSADLQLMRLDTADQMVLGNVLLVKVGPGGGALAVGATPAAAGMIRLPTSPTISNRNAANTADEQIWPHLTAEAALGVDVAITPANTYVDGPSVSLAPGVWFITGTVTFNADGQKSWTAKLWDGTTTESSTEYTKVTTGTGGDVGTMSLSGIVTLAATATWKISVATTSASGTGLYAAAPQNGAGNNASHIKAVRIG